MEPIIADFFPESVSVRPGYESFFNGLIRLTTGKEPDKGLGDSLQTYVQEFLASDFDLDNFKNPSGTQYERNYLGQDAGSGWEAILMSWRQGHRTTIHGHPSFASYCFASGRFRVELFERTDGAAPRPVHVFEAGEGEGFFAIGMAKSFENHIHRITCLSETGHSLHVYSDDARRGVVYGE